MPLEKYLRCDKKKINEAFLILIIRVKDPSLTFYIVSNKNFSFLLPSENILKKSFEGDLMKLKNK